jgi:hypothetical protein
MQHLKQFWFIRIRSDGGRHPFQVLICPSINTNYTTARFSVHQQAQYACKLVKTWILQGIPSTLQNLTSRVKFRRNPIHRKFEKKEGGNWGKGIAFDLRMESRFGFRTGQNEGYT